MPVCWSSILLIISQALVTADERVVEQEERMLRAMALDEDTLRLLELPMPCLTQTRSEGYILDEQPSLEVRPDITYTQLCVLN